QGTSGNERYSGQPARVRPTYRGTHGRERVRSKTREEFFPITAFFWGSDGVAYCSDGPGGFFHEGADECFREVVPLGRRNVAGSQRCYDEAGNLITTGRAAGSFDVYAVATSANADGECLPGSSRRILYHFLYDVIPDYTGGL